MFVQFAVHNGRSTVCLRLFFVLTTQGAPAQTAPDHAAAGGGSGRTVMGQCDEAADDLRDEPCNSKCAK